MSRVQKSFVKTALGFATIAGCGSVLYWSHTTTITVTPVVSGGAVVAALFVMCWLIVYELSGGKEG